MAQLKDLLVNGASRFIGDAIVNKIQITKLYAPTGSNSTTYGVGSNGQTLMSNGTSIYWATIDTGVSGVKGNSETNYRTGNVNISATNIGLGNVENTKLSTWAGSANITTIGTLSSGTVPWARLSNVPTATDAALGLAQAGTGLGVTSGVFSVTYGTTANTACQGNDGRLSDARTPTSHTHGNLTNDGKLGTNSGYAVYTTTDGAITAGAIATSDPTASGNSTTFIATISQDNKGKITATKKSLDTTGTWSGNASTATTADHVGHTLTIGDKTFDGSAAVTVEIADLGLAGSSMEFKGIITETLTDNSASPTTVNYKTGGTLTPVEGNVVIDATGKEYIWTNSKWSNLGLATDYALSEHIHGNITNTGKLSTTINLVSETINKAVITNTANDITTISLASSDPTASNTTSTTFIDTISQSAIGKITATKKTLPTASTTAPGIIQIGTGATNAAAGNHSHTITANATDGYWDITGTNGTDSVTYAMAPYSSKQNSACFYTGTTAPNGTTRLNYNGYLYATKLYSGGTEVLAGITNNNATLSWDSAVNIASVGGTNISVSLPANPGLELIRLIS